MTTALRDLALRVFASAACGISVSDSRLDNLPVGYRMSFSQALVTTSETMFARVLIPRLFYELPIDTLRQSDTAYAELPRHIKQLITDVREQGKKASTDDLDNDADLFRRLVAANELETDMSIRLTDDELVANLYAFFLAGHETSAHTLAFCFGLLALHPEVQDHIYGEANQVWTSVDDNASALTDFNKLDYTLAVIRETLRLFPAELKVIRVSTRDTSLPSLKRQVDGSWAPENVDVPRGTTCVINIHALHMSPLYWGDDVELFRPERFLDSEHQWPKDAWIPFTAGPHVCIGQRFALIEMVCTVARLVLKYRLAPPPEILTLSRAEQYEKLLSYTIAATTTPGNVNLVLTRRHR